MKKYFLLITILSLLLIVSGCGQSIQINNIPFAVIDKNDFTLEELARKINEPLLIATDKEEILKNAYRHIRKREPKKELTIDQNNELVVLVFRGSKGGCEHADIAVKKISREKDILKVEVEIDKNIEAEIKTCPILMNPYIIIKLKKADIQYNKGLKIALIDKSKEKPLMATAINKIPGYLK